jgi:hypothetical protein
MAKLLKFPGIAAISAPIPTLENELLALQKTRLQIELETARLENQSARAARAELAWRTLRRAIFWFGLLWLLFSIFGNSAKAEPSRSRAFYDRSGSFAGSTITRGNSTNAYDKNGHLSGTIIRNSNGTSSFYDGRGHFAGSSVNTTQPR